MIDSARYYMNEAQVGEGVRRSGIPREQIFISTNLCEATIHWLIWRFSASKIYHPDFGYERAKECILESVDKLGLGRSSLSNTSSLWERDKAITTCTWSTLRLPERRSGSKHIEPSSMLKGMALWRGLVFRISGFIVWSFRPCLLEN